MIGYYITKLELSVKGIIYSGKKNISCQSNNGKHFSRRFSFVFFLLEKGTISFVIKNIQDMLNTCSKDADCYFSGCGMTRQFNLNSTYEYAGKLLF